MNQYTEQYKSKLTTLEGVAGCVNNGDCCCSDIAQNIPYTLINAVAERVKRNEITGITYHSLLDMAPIACYQENLGEGMKGCTGFASGISRNTINKGFGELYPCYYRDIPDLIREFIDVDVFFAVVSPMDEHGYLSFGSIGSCVEALLSKAKKICLQVNTNMPRALGGSQVHISRVTALYETNEPMPMVSAAKIDDLSLQIGNIVAEEIPNGATIQLGIGAIPEAITEALKGKRDLGIHTELLTEGMVDLVNCGAVTNACKPLHTGMTVATFAVGGQKMYDFIHNNPSVKILPVDYVNDPAVIAQHPNFISVNAALEVDFLGQVCAESMGTLHVSGTGGQTDYVRGATHSKGGKSFIVFPSTAKGGTISRIVTTLTPGAAVSTSKNDVDHIVTEYGVAKLRGKSLSQRTKALISIAHPKFREELTFEAKKRNIII